MKNDLDTRIADAFSNMPSSAILTDLLTEVAKADAEAKEASKRAAEIALDPATRPDAVADARKLMEDSDFSSCRLAIAAEKLLDLKRQALERERKAADIAEYTAAKAERDQLAEDIAREYPALASGIADILTRLQSNNQRVDAINTRHAGPWLRQAEPIARNAPENWEVNTLKGASRLLNARIPHLVQGNDNIMEKEFLWIR